MQAINIGSNANTPADDLVSFSVRSGETITVKVVGGSTINYHSKGHSGGSTGTITNGNTQTFTATGTHYLASQGASSITISGGLY